MFLGLVQLFEAVIGGTGVALPGGTGRPKACDDGQGELFGGPDNPAGYFTDVNETDIAIVTGMHAKTGIDFSVLKPGILDLFELSADAFGAIVYAWMSELPITGRIIGFGKKILSSQNTLTNTVEPARRGEAEAARREAAKRAATDRGDPDVRTVREAAYKVWHEIHRLMGLLRFCPDEKGVYTALCEPDHFVLPALGPHFMERFGETPWAIIDNRRRFSLACDTGREGAPGGTPVFSAGTGNSPPFAKAGEWENLWKHYHKTVNNESRHNPALQKRFMPARYWKYLTEL